MSRKIQLVIMMVILIIVITASCLWIESLSTPKPVTKPSFGGCTCSDQTEEVYEIGKV